MQIPQDVTIQKQLTDLRVQEWLENNLFSPQWWALIAILTALAVLWCIFVSKPRLPEISLFLFLAVILFMGINEYGEELTLWDYPADVIAWFPPLSSVCLILLSLGFSLIYQQYETLKAFAAASFAFSAAVCFIVQPLLAAARMFRLIHWQYYEGLPVYFLAAVVTRSLVRAILELAERQKRVVK